MKVPKPNSAFTLIELLVVVGIIAIVVAMLIPALRAANVAAKGAECMANLHGISVGERMFADSNGGGVTETLNLLFRYTTTNIPDNIVKATACPAWYDYVDSGGNAVANAGSYGIGYGWNTFMPNGTKLTAIRNPAEVVMMADTVATDGNGIVLATNQGLEDPFWCSTYISTVKPLLPNFHGRHGTAGSVLWCDGHATKVTPTNVPSTITISNKNGWCHKPAAYYNQRHIGYLVRSQADLFSMAGEYYFVSRKEVLPGNNLLLMVDPNPTSPVTYSPKPSMWQ